MATLKPEVLAVLEGTCSNVSYQYPASWEVLPAISYREADNRNAGLADTREHITELAYVIDFWGVSQGQVDTLYETVNAALQDLNFVREFAYDLRDLDSSIRHKTTRYRAYLGVDNRIYQHP